MNNITNDAQSVEEVQETSALEAGIFSPDDLLNVQRADFSELKNAALKLAKLAQAEPQLEGFSDSKEFGRFEFGEGSQSAIAYQSAFRLCRAALSFLEADFLSCARWEAKSHFREAQVFQGVSQKTAQEQVADLYWQVQECLSAAGMAFDDLAQYHAKSDGEVEA